MDFDFSDDQEMLRDSVRKWVAKGYDFERRKTIVKAGGFSREAWRAIADLGLTGLVVPEAHGGMGFGAIDAMVVMEELGRGLVLEPYAQGALIAGGVLAAYASAELQAAWLPKIASGDALIVLAQQERAARYRLNHVSTTAAPAGNAWSVSGAKSIVPVGD
ncbi:MAG TPA: acyl-CoA dehydrogenase family protein, partial [Albitalea sp.]|nr:acyl-CoA dehydrogenase family protein [Albitalea sp.]